MPSQPKTVPQIVSQTEQCIENCLYCHRLCLETITHCLEMGGEHAEASHIKLLLDCAEICQTSANFMLRSSDLHPSLCAICAQICEQCAEHCERFSEDAKMQACAAICRRCAESCQLIVANAAPKA
jgi:hypothetical protein